MIDGYMKENMERKAMQFFEEMKRDGFSIIFPNQSKRIVYYPTMKL